MILKLCNIFNILCHSILFVLCCNSVADKKNKLSILRAIVLIILIFAGDIILTYSNIFINNTSLVNFIIVLIVLLSASIFYKKSIIDAFIGIGLGYSITIISTYCLTTMYYNILAKLNFKISTEVQMLLFIYIPIWMAYFFVYKYRKHIFGAVRYLKGLRTSLVFILAIDYALIFLDTLRIEWVTHDMRLVFKSILYFTVFIVFLIAVVYFAKVNDKSKEIEMLNAALNEKITELRKVKHDYGSEISGLYGLYQLGKMDRFGEMLKAIVQRNQDLNTAVHVNEEGNTIVASVLHSASSAGIDVVVFDSANYEDLSVTDNELFRLLSNIIENSIDVLCDIKNPIIKYRSYNSYNGIVITIINNGPKIPESIKNKIFESGFSTKKNESGRRGYGLSIVADIIKKCNGEISVESDENWTEFRLEIPYVKFKKLKA